MPDMGQADLFFVVKTDFGNEVPGDTHEHLLILVLQYLPPTDNAELICFAAGMDHFLLLVRVGVSFAWMTDSWYKFNPDKKKVLWTVPTITILRTPGIAQVALINWLGAAAGGLGFMSHFRQPLQPEVVVAECRSPPAGLGKVEILGWLSRSQPCTGRGHGHGCPTAPSIAGA